jgi:hypothetical protein
LVDIGGEHLEGPCRRDRDRNTHACAITAQDFSLPVRRGFSANALKA